ncbi:MAG: hypothetical protein V3V46_08995 [Anaerolineales bacterium]
MIDCPSLAIACVYCSISTIVVSPLYKCLTVTFRRLVIGEDIIIYADCKIKYGIRLSEAPSHKPLFSIGNELLEMALLGTNPYMLNTVEGGKNTLLHDLGVEREIHWLTAGT